jgi:hypothetical protein
LSYLSYTFYQLPEIDLNDPNKRGLMLMMKRTERDDKTLQVISAEGPMLAVAMEFHEEADGRVLLDTFWGPYSEEIRPILSPVISGKDFGPPGSIISITPDVYPDWIKRAIADFDPELLNEETPF